MLTEYIKYSNFNSTFNRQKLLTERDNVKRFLYIKIEFYTLIRKSVVSNKYIQKSSKYIIQTKTHKLTKLNSLTLQSNRCLWTGRKHGTYLKYKSGGLFIKNNPGMWYFLTKYNK